MAEIAQKEVVRDDGGFNFGMLPTVEDSLDSTLDFKERKKELEELEENPLEGTQESDNSQDTDSPNKLILDWAKKKGIVDYDEKTFEDTEDYVSSVFSQYHEQILQKKLDERIDSLPEVAKKLMKEYREGLPLAELLESQATQEMYSSIDPKELETDKDLQKEVITRFLASQDYTADEIKTKLSKYEDLGDDFLKDEAKLGLSKLIRSEEKYQNDLRERAKADEINRKSRRESELKEFETKVMQRDEIFPGIKLSQEDKKLIFESLTKPVGTDKAGRPINAINKMQMEDPDFNLKVAYIFKVLKGDLSSLKKNVTTSSLKDLRSKLQPQEQSTDKTLLAIRKAIKAEKEKHKLF